MNADFFVNNRRNVIKKLNGGIVVLRAYTQQQRSGDSSFAFEQEANFWYLTGISRPNWLVIMDGTSGEEWLVAPDIDEVHQVFDGSLSTAEATKTSGIKTVVDYDTGMNILRRLAKKHSVVHTVGMPPHAQHFDFALNPSIAANKKMLERIFASVVDCQKDIAALRAIKQPSEIKAIQQAINLTIDAFRGVQSTIDSYKYEYEIEAEFTYQFRRHNATHAYDPIVANAKNACTLHYIENGGKLAPKSVTLLDIGARLNGYAADITRSYARGEISKRKKEVHAAVERAHHEIIQLIAPDVSIETYQTAVDKIMQSILMQLGLITNEHDEKYRHYFPHAISHGLGIDVHDSLGGARYFSPNMVLTVEPGIYIPEENIGVRIEDDILVTENGHKNMSVKLPTGY